jgi:hypothetical protein
MNKKNNVGLIFELLAQQVVSQSISRNEAGAKKALYLIKKYFKKGTTLNEELKLFNTILYNQVPNMSTRSRLLSEVLKASKKIDIKSLRNERYNLLIEVYNNYDKDKFFDSFIPSYKIYSAIYQLMENERRLAKLEIDVKVMLEEQVLNHLGDNKEVKRIFEFKNFVDENYNLNDLEYFFVIKKFNQKYDKSLTQTQKEILKEYIQCTSEKQFDQYAKKVSQRIEQDLYEGMKTIKDKPMLSKLFEAMKKFTDVLTLSKEKKCEALMSYQELVDEIKKYSNELQKVQ